MTIPQIPCYAVLKLLLSKKLVYCFLIYPPVNSQGTSKKYPGFFFFQNTTQMTSGSIANIASLCLLSCKLLSGSLSSRPLLEWPVKSLLHHSAGFWSKVSKSFTFLHEKFFTATAPLLVPISVLVCSLLL